MREIKFRGRREDIGWKYGYLTCIEHRELIDWEQKPAIRPFNELFITYGVNPDTVGQYTGLIDKNGKEIYEGDIVKITCGCGHTENLPIKSKDGYNGFYLEAKCQHNWDNDQLRLNWSEHMEVIGNIYENPELLKE